MEAYFCKNRNLVLPFHLKNKKPSFFLSPYDNNYYIIYYNEKEEIDTYLQICPKTGRKLSFKKFLPNYKAREHYIPFFSLYENNTLLFVTEGPEDALSLIELYPYSSAVAVRGFYFFAKFFLKNTELLQQYKNVIIIRDNDDLKTRKIELTQKKYSNSYNLSYLDNNLLKNSLKLDYVEFFPKHYKDINEYFQNCQKNIIKNEIDFFLQAISLL